MPRFIRKRGSNHLEPNKLVYSPHEKLALLFARYGDWTQQSHLAEGRAEDILIAYGNRIPTVGTPVQVSRELVRKNYKILCGPCARLCDSNTARHVDLMLPEEIGRLVELYVPRAA